jgi:hypothetical protein
VTESSTSRPGRNDRCPCGSGKKYKQCCLAKDAAADRKAREEAAKSAPLPAPDEEAAETSVSRPPTGRRKSTDQPWKRGQQQAQGFQKRSGPRKRGGS